MAARNDITGDVIQSKGSSRAYEDGWDRIFGKKTEWIDFKDRQPEIGQKVVCYWPENLEDDERTVILEWGLPSNTNQQLATKWKPLVDPDKQ